MTANQPPSRLDSEHRDTPYAFQTNLPCTDLRVKLIEGAWASRASTSHAAYGEAPQSVLGDYGGSSQTRV